MPWEPLIPPTCYQATIMERISFFVTQGSVILRLSSNAYDHYKNTFLKYPESPHNTSIYLILYYPNI